VNARTVGRPEPDEIPSHFVGYIKRVPELDPVIVCASQIEDTAALLRGLSDADAMHRYARDKWSVKEIVGHLADIERIMAYRALRIARGDTTPLRDSMRTRMSRSQSSTPARSPISSASCVPPGPRPSPCCAHSMPMRGADAAPRAATR